MPISTDVFHIMGRDPRRVLRLNRARGDKYERYNGPFRIYLDLDNSRVHVGAGYVRAGNGANMVFPAGLSDATHGYASYAALANDQIVYLDISVVNGTGAFGAAGEPFVLLSNALLNHATNSVKIIIGVLKMNGLGDPGAIDQQLRWKHIDVYVDESSGVYNTTYED